ncbi:MAG TPA: MmcQ/YjbR family DNA-binding protein [Candidatus Limnocylindria bacterium]|nr:MmcQ/YjbR family DNA-binding protein [Candidatus Limnocylindria bacterium]
MTRIKPAKAQLLKYALAKPEATLHHPWGENVAKVRGKVFVFFGMAEPAKDAPYADYVMGVKLTNALLFAKSQPYVEAMGYGLGKSGWVSVKMPEGAAPLAMFKEWIDESYETVAPKPKALRSRRVSPSAAGPRGGAARAAPSRTSTRRAARSSPGRGRPTRS